MKSNSSEVKGEHVILYQGKHLFLQLMTIDEALELLFKRKKWGGEEEFGLGKHGFAPNIAKGFYETVRWNIGDSYDYDFYFPITGSIYTLRDRRIAIVWKIGWLSSNG
jgi:hypothetical protein